MKLLHEAARRAARIRLRYPKMIWGLGSIGVRSDGAVVHADNGGVRTAHGGRLPCGHAEVRLARRLTPYSTVYVARVVYDAQGSLVWAMAKPCANCERRLRNAGVRRVFYTIAPGEYGVLSFA